MNVYVDLRAAESAIHVQDSVIRPAAERDAAASFDRLAAEHYGRIARLVDRLSGWRGDRDDLVQEVFVAAWRAWPSFREESRAETWLTRIAINTCRTQRRRQWLRTEVWRRLTEIVHAWDHREPHENLASEESSEGVRRAIASLAQRDREVLVLRYLEEQSIEDIATSLDLTRGAVEVRLSRARLRLKSKLTDENADRP
jgi:RNA polymerase sigma factor (sigma-70 family)